MQHIAVDGSIHQGDINPCASCEAMIEDGFADGGSEYMTKIKAYDLMVAEGLIVPAGKVVSPANTQKTEDWINPVHYQRGPIPCIELCSAIPDFRLASAMKYLYRVAFGGKMGEDEKQDIRKAIWYLNHFVEN